MLTLKKVWAGGQVPASRVVTLNTYDRFKYHLVIFQHLFGLDAELKYSSYITGPSLATAGDPSSERPAPGCAWQLLDSTGTDLSMIETL